MNFFINFLIKKMFRWLSRSKYQWLIDLKMIFLFIWINIFAWANTCFQLLVVIKSLSQNRVYLWAFFTIWFILFIWILLFFLLNFIIDKWVNITLANYCGHKFIWLLVFFCNIITLILLLNWWLLFAKLTILFLNLL